MDEEQQTIVVKERRPLVDTKTLIIGGGLVALVLFFLFRGKGWGWGRGGGGRDAKPLLFKLRSTGLFLGDKQMTVADAIARALAGGRKDALLQTAGDVRQGDVDALDIAFQQAGIVLRSQQPTASYYSRGMGKIA